MKCRQIVFTQKNETYLPEECPEVYNRLISDKNFPVVVQFDWRDEK